MSVCLAARQHAAAPGNEYLLISQSAVVAALERLAGQSPDLAHFRFRDACGYEAVPQARAVAGTCCATPPPPCSTSTWPPSPRRCST